jgi:hypothetical protein
LFHDVVLKLSQSPYRLAGYERMKWTCFICGQVMQKFSLVVPHVEKHKQDQEKPTSLVDRVYEDWRRENK